jgi:hypothetical protein
MLPRPFLAQDAFAFEQGADGDRARFCGCCGCVRSISPSSVAQRRCAVTCRRATTEIGTPVLAPTTSITGLYGSWLAGYVLAGGVLSCMAGQIRVQVSLYLILDRRMGLIRLACSFRLVAPFCAMTSLIGDGACYADRYSLKL